ncbi:MAG TPA: hypothetical protein VKU90_13710 [Caulobacteraceae bacterium]|nr:hypothetical protein [Caulobacteraceae bacterium]
MTEAELLGAARRIDMRRKMGMIVAALGGVIGAICVLQLIPGDPGGPADRLEISAFAAISLTCIAAGLALILGGRLPAEAKTPRLAMLRAEAQQLPRQTAFLLMPLSLAFMLVGVVGAAVHVMHGEPMRRVEMFSTGAFVFFLAAFGFILAGGGIIGRWARSVLDDELTRTLRARALQLGYAILLPGVAIVFVVGLFRRDLAVELAPIVAALGVAAPAVRLFMLERAATGDDDEA